MPEQQSVFLFIYLFERVVWVSTSVIQITIVAYTFRNLTTLFPFKAFWILSPCTYWSFIYFKECFSFFCFLTWKVINWDGASFPRLRFSLKEITPENNLGFCWDLPLFISPVVEVCLWVCAYRQRPSENEKKCCWSFRTAFFFNKIQMDVATARAVSTIIGYLFSPFFFLW